MKRLARLIGFLVCATALLAAASVERRADGLTVTTATGLTRIEIWHEQTVRVVHLAQPGPVPSGSSAVNTRPVATKWKFSETPGYVQLATARLHVRVSKADGGVTFLDPAGATLLAESSAASATTLSQSFVLDPAEGIFGLGQQQKGDMNRVGTRVHLQQINTDVAVPVLLSSKGYLVLWDNAAITDVDVGAADKACLTWSSEAGEAVDYYFCAGPRPDDAIAAYRVLTGPAPLMARWTWGFWQCRERYKTQDEILGVVAEYRKRGVPLDGIIQDWQYWGKEQWGTHEFEAVRYADPTAMVEAVHAAHAHIIISVWPKFDLGTTHLAELEKAGAVLAPVFPSVYPKGQNKWYDPYHPAGRALYWQQISAKLFARGFDGWWLDASEPELGGKWGELRDLATAAGPGKNVFNSYPLFHTTGIHDGQRAENPAKRVFLLTRSAFAGQQRNAAITWSGDIKGTWEVYRAQLPAGLNFVASGLPYWNTDIGGFFGGNPADLKYTELFTRWFQYGAFCPMFRVHGTGRPKEIWRWDDATQRIMADFIRLRYHLLPYIYSTSWQVTNAGSSLMRPLVLDFPHDTAALNVPDEFMFGPALLIAPVIQPGATARSVHLPAGASWIDFWTGASHAGGAAIEAAAPIERLPLFVRAGSILPLGPAVQYVDEKPADPLELRIYRGADGVFTLYEDEGDNYNYEKGAHATISFHWDDRKQALTIGKCSGDFPGLLRKRTFRLVWVAPDHGTGIALVPTADLEVSYRGKALTVRPPVAR